MKEKITFVCITVPRLNKLQVLVPKVLPYVDEAVLVVGRRDEEAENWLRQLSPKIKMIYRPWDDNFANQWNVYLRHVKDSWVLITDDDEIPSDDLLKSLSTYVEKSEQGNKFCCVEFRANPISEGQDMGPVNYWRQIFFRVVPGMRYHGGIKTGCHQFLVGYQNGNIVRANQVYYHIKSLREEYQNASRNYFIYGIWPHGSRDGEQREEWHKMKEVLAKVYPDVKTFPDLDKYLIQGNVKQEFKDWLTENFKKYETHSEYNEFRALYQYYFKYLHPEELMEKI